MGFSINEKVILSYHGFCVVERSISEKFHDYSVARETAQLPQGYAYLVNTENPNTFTTLTECEAFFSGVVTSKVIDETLKANGQLTVSQAVLPVMAEINALFSKLK